MTGGGKPASCQEGSQAFALFESNSRMVHDPRSFDWWCVPRRLFNGVCGGCHGSISGLETDVAVTADALTGASVSLSRDREPKPLK